MLKLWQGCLAAVRRLAAPPLRGVGSASSGQKLGAGRCVVHTRETFGFTRRLLRQTGLRERHAALGRRRVRTDALARGAVYVHT